MKLHAVASVLTEHMHDFFIPMADASNSQAIYIASDERLAAKDWRGG